ncbi:hypothetical protein BEWA_054720 [Theileria equi strain WA]|uniref:ER membrane protein complex subunit 4 n=1 Tax=Theileria equi strain WA TaxID=1537102 RepID=L1LDU1_THEEQ|nr:hypothetical protein BEWA_054720 [Theileria equi strain WA]EKX73415.1 hypothetical protein BEWA_054720 [Theileria equi strain WA]|eukprot:XP_004832867.1 hypothetical protein BEWA_054720 [Theileria equi strain WA]
MGAKETQEEDNGLPFLPPPVGYRKYVEEKGKKEEERVTIASFYEAVKRMDKRGPIHPEILAMQKRNAMVVTFRWLKDVLYNIFVYFLTSRSYYIFGFAYSLYFLKEQVVSLFNCQNVFRRAAPNLKFHQVILHKVAYVALHLVAIYLILKSIHTNGYIPMRLADYIHLFPMTEYRSSTLFVP